jgi:MoxR-like ATPase
VSTVEELLPDVEATADLLRRVGYLPDDGLSTALFCAARLPQPILLEGEAGVGKTEAAKSLAAALDTALIRLQCYEGIDAGEALYEWNYTRQLLAIRLAESRHERLDEADMFDESFLVERPILSALRHPGPRPAVLLVDEIDRADDEFEAFLLEVLAESSVTIPELGTQRAEHPPIVVLTSNRTRDLHDALKRRCLYHWIDYPTRERATEIIRSRVPASSEPLAEQVASAVARLRTLDVQKVPGIAEAIGWVNALRLLGFDVLDEHAARLTIGSVLKYREDAELLDGTPGRRSFAWLVDA